MSKVALVLESPLMAASAKEVILRTSERSTFGRCPQRWEWSWRYGLRPIAPPSNPLWLGDLVHQSLAAWYVPGFKRGPHPAETFERLAEDDVRRFKVDYPDGNYDEQKFVDGVELGVAMLTGYVEHWGKDESWEIISPEAPAQVRVRRNYVGEGATALYGMRLDAVYRDHSLKRAPFRILETKTAASISTSYLTLDSQASTYWALGTTALRSAGFLGSKDIIESITYSFLRKAMPDTRPINPAGMRCNIPKKEDYQAQLKMTADDMKRRTIPELEKLAQSRGITVYGAASLKQPAAWFVRHEEMKTRGHLNSQISHIEDQLEVMDAMRDGDLPVYKVPVQMGPMACAGCPFFAMCELHEAGGDWEEYRDLAFTVADPYADHRLLR